MSTSLFRFRVIAFIEGMSYIILLFIAMPLKYWAGMPTAVRIVGMAHGVLFLLFLVSMIEVIFRYKLSFVRAVLIFISSLVPFGTFVLDTKLLCKLQAEERK
jgi:integral membrane protein